MCVVCLTLKIVSIVKYLELKMAWWTLPIIIVFDFQNVIFTLPRILSSIFIHITQFKTSSTFKLDHNDL